MESTFCPNHFKSKIGYTPQDKHDNLFANCTLGMACLRSTDIGSDWFRTRNGSVFVIEGNTFLSKDQTVRATILKPLWDWLQTEHKDYNEVVLCVNETDGYASIMSPEMEKHHKVRSMEGKVCWGITMG